METLIPKNIAIRFVYTVSLVEIPGIPNRRGRPDGFPIPNNVDVLPKQAFHGFCVNRVEINKLQVAVIRREIPGSGEIIFHKGPPEKTFKMVDFPPAALSLSGQTCQRILCGFL